LKLEGIHASLSDENPAESLERNYQEILKVLDIMHLEKYKEISFRGCTAKYTGEPMMSDAVNNMIRVARDESREGPLYVVTTGCGTNVANAIQAAPDIKDKIVVVWLAGNSLHWNNTMECNLWTDTKAGEFLLDCEVPLVLLPAYNVVSELRTTIYELEYYLSDKNDICDYLLGLVRNYKGPERKEGEAWSKVIWDVAGVAYVMHPYWFATRLNPTPVFGYNWINDPGRHLMRLCDNLKRDAIYMSLFEKLGGC